MHGSHQKSFFLVSSCLSENELRRERECVVFKHKRREYDLTLFDLHFKVPWAERLYSVDTCGAYDHPVQLPRISFLTKLFYYEDS